MSNTAKCLCGHSRIAHTSDGCCLSCEAKGQHCLGYWTQEEYDAATRDALMQIARRMAWEAGPKEGENKNE